MHTENDKLAAQVNQSGPLHDVAPVVEYAKKYRCPACDARGRVNAAPVKSTVQPF